MFVQYKLLSGESLSSAEWACKQKELGEEWRALPEAEKDAWKDEARYQQEQRNRSLLAPLKSAEALKLAQVSCKEAHAFTHGYDSDDHILKKFCNKASFQRLQLNYLCLERAPAFSTHNLGLQDYHAALRKQHIDLQTPLATVQALINQVFGPPPKLTIHGGSKASEQGFFATSCFCTFGCCEKSEHIDAAVGFSKAMVRWIKRHEFPPGTLAIVAPGPPWTNNRYFLGPVRRPEGGHAFVTFLKAHRVDMDGGESDQIQCHGIIAPGADFPDVLNSTSVFRETLAACSQNRQDSSVHVAVLPWTLEHFADFHSLRVQVDVSRHMHVTSLSELQELKTPSVSLPFGFKMPSSGRSKRRSGTSKPTKKADNRKSLALQAKVIAAKAMSANAKGQTVQPSAPAPVVSDSDSEVTSADVLVVETDSEEEQLPSANKEELGRVRSEQQSAAAAARPKSHIGFCGIGLASNGASKCLHCLNIGKPEKDCKIPNRAIRFYYQWKAGTSSQTLGHCRWLHQHCVADYLKSQLERNPDLRGTLIEQLASLDTGGSNDLQAAIEQAQRDLHAS